MLKIGHRGARAYEPENTLLSFKKAIDLGVDAIEFDVRKTRDGELVVIHDADVSKTTDGRGLVGELTLEEINHLSAEKGQKIPTFEESLDFLDGKVKIVIELKESGLEEIVVNLLHIKEIQENVIVVSFNEDVLRAMKHLDENIETGLIYVRHKDPLSVALKLKAEYILPLYRFVHTADIRRAHEKGLKVIAWTINSRDEAIEYARKGLDGIASDKPDILNAIN